MSRPRKECWRSRPHKESSVFLSASRLPLSFPRGLRRLHRLDAGDGWLKLLGHPGIEALAGNARRQIDLAVKLRRIAGNELAREGFVRLFPTLLAEGEIIVSRILEGGLQLVNAALLEGDHVPRVDDLAV
jgi:hypothetical protein